LSAVLGFLSFWEVSAPNLALYGRNSAVEDHNSSHIIDEIGETDLRFTPLQFDGADNHAHPLFLMAEDMFDLGSDF